MLELLHRPFHLWALSLSLSQLSEQNHTSEPRRLGLPFLDFLQEFVQFLDLDCDLIVG